MAYNGYAVGAVRLAILDDDVRRTKVRRADNWKANEEAARKRREQHAEERRKAA
jgi:hypothetical protein